MEDSRKKPIMIGIIVVCLVAAALITYISSSPEGTGLNVFEDQMTWVKCTNPDCGATYQMNLKEYYEFMKENSVDLNVPPMDCKECGEGSVFRAVKCEKEECGEVFLHGAKRGDFVDRCTKCGHSKMEEEIGRR